jgi:threonyl-tRNA synthetase
VLPISDRHTAHGAEVAAELRELGVRVEVDWRSESIGKKVRDAELGRFPYMLVIGDREQESGEVAVRSHRGGELGTMGLAEFADRVHSDERQAEDDS